MENLANLANKFVNDEWSKKVLHNFFLNFCISIPCITSCSISHRNARNLVKTFFKAWSTQLWDVNGISSRFITHERWCDVSRRKSDYERVWVVWSKRKVSSCMKKGHFTLTNEFKSSNACVSMDSSLFCFLNKNF